MLLFHVLLRARFLDRSIRTGFMWVNVYRNGRNPLEKVSVYIACNCIIYCRTCLFSPKRQLLILKLF